jgi:succinate dehydrogenase flavin-adding protein (antitoxin of CptAB toxin-antitoxin module)
MRELDVLLTRYLDERFCSAPHPERQAFGRLLETQDPLLYAYCLGSAPPPAEFAALLERITSKPCA